MIKPINFTQAQKNNSIQMPTQGRNYIIFNQSRVDFYVSKREQALPYVKNVLRTSNDEKEVVEALYITDRLIENGTKGIPQMYPLLAKYNNTKSPNIQTYLAGIYRKTQVPDAFGPLVKMLIKNSLEDGKRGIGNDKKTVQPLFDPNEEIGGAILEYIKNYSNNPKKIDYSA